ncbi:hypothetical protein OSB04_007798 [Centaurea solstitialis]|uniref:HECT domain-containing protein n=1 Tax=Centaurea solstitialis TaxID=347529 RepID=A0AA38TT37_9ASTR|nr:hypothetical protein OSB04_007798 [Centaurea solstitialis]
MWHFRKNIRVTKEMKHEYADVVEHKLANAICPQINSFSDRFNELIPQEAFPCSIKNLELLINGLEKSIDLGTVYLTFTKRKDMLAYIRIPENALSPGTQRLLPFIEIFLVLCERLRDKGYDDTSSDSAMTFARFAEKHWWILNAFVRQNPRMLENSLSMLLKAPRLMDFDNKRFYFRSKVLLPV